MSQDRRDGGDQRHLKRSKRGAQHPLSQRVDQHHWCCQKQQRVTGLIKNQRQHRGADREQQDVFLKIVPLDLVALIVTVAKRQQAEPAQGQIQPVGDEPLQPHRKIVRVGDQGQDPGANGCRQCRCHHPGDPQ